MIFLTNVLRTTQRKEDSLLSKLQWENGYIHAKDLKCLLLVEVLISNGLQTKIKTMNKIQNYEGDRSKKKKASCQAK